MLHKKFVLLLVSAATSTAFGQPRTFKETYRINISREENGKILEIDTTFTDAAHFNLFLKQNHLNELPPPPLPPPDAASQHLLPPVPASPLGKAPDCPPLPPETEQDNYFLDQEEWENDLHKLKEELNHFRFELYTEDETGRKHEFKKELNLEKDSLLELYLNEREFRDPLKCLDSMSFKFNFSTDETHGHPEKSVIVLRYHHINGIKEQGMEEKNHGDHQSERKNDKDAYELSLEKFLISPNPCNGKFQLSFSSESKSPVTISIYDFNGSEVYNEKKSDFSGSYNEEINIAGKSKGNYVLKIKQDNKWLSRQVVIN